MSAVAPPGGCSVRVRCIAAMAVDTASAAASPGYECKTRQQSTPTMALRRWPPTRFRGCAKGLRGVPYSSTADAPSEPSISVRSSPASTVCPIPATVAMPTKAPSQDQATSALPTRGGLPRSPPRILRR